MKVANVTVSATAQGFTWGLVDLAGNAGRSAVAVAKGAKLLLMNIDQMYNETDRSH
jgi:hypothetical protein